MKRQMISLLGALALATGTTGALAQDKVVTLKLSYWVPPSHLLTPGYKDWAAALEKAIRLAKKGGRNARIPTS